MIAIIGNFEQAFIFFLDLLNVLAYIYRFTYPCIYDVGSVYQRVVLREGYILVSLAKLKINTHTIHIQLQSGKSSVVRIIVMQSFMLHHFYNMNVLLICLLGLKKGFCSESTGVTRVTSLCVVTVILFSAIFEHTFLQFYDKMRIYQCIKHFTI